MWYPDQKGLFSVRNGYRILHSLAAPHNPTMDPSTWNITWNVLIPGKMKHFMWRACTNYLPTMQTLLWKKVVDSGLCPMCIEEAEDTFHALVGCGKVRRIWGSLAVGETHGMASDFACWWEASCKLETTERRCEIVATCWAVWKGRNSFGVE